MLNINVSVKPSPIHGLGCFADEPIKKGTIVWQLDKRLDLHIPQAELEALPPAAQAFLHMYAYGANQDGQPVWILCGDHAKHMNHSDTPNLASCGPNQEMDMALRDIEPGEELTCNYYEFDLNHAEKLGGA